MIYTIKFNETNYGSECGLIQAEQIAESIADAAAIQFPDVEFETKKSDFCNEARDQFDGPEDLETEISEWIESNWIDIINTNSDEIFKSTFQDVFSDVESKKWDMWFDYYADQTGDKVQAQSKMQGTDFGVKYYFSDDPELPQDLKEQFAIDKKISVIVGVQGEWSNLTSYSNESEIRSFLEKFYGDLPDSDE